MRRPERRRIQLGHSDFVSQQREEPELVAAATLVALVTLMALVALMALMAFATVAAAARARATTRSNAVFQPLHLEHARSHHAFSKEMKGIELTGFHRN